MACGNVYVDVDGNVSDSVDVSVVGYVDGCVSGLTNFLLVLGTAQYLLHQAFIGPGASARGRILIQDCDLVVCFLNFDIAWNDSAKDEISIMLTNSLHHFSTDAHMIVKVCHNSEDGQGNVKVVSQFLHGAL